MSELELVVQLEGHEGPITGLHFSSDFNYLISSSEDTSLIIWNLKTNKLVTKFNGHNGSVNSFVVNRANTRILSGGSDSSICWWDVQRGELIKKIRRHTERVNSVCFNDDSSIAISGSVDHKVMIWDCRSNGNIPVQILSDASNSVKSVVAGRYEIFTASLDGRLRIYDIRRGRLTTDKVADALVDIQLSEYQQVLLLSTLDSRIMLVNKTDGDIQQTYTGHKCENYIIRSRFAAREAAVISGSEDGEVFMWDLVDKTVKQRFAYGSGPILDVEVNNPFTSIVVGSSDGNIGIFQKKSLVM